MFVYMTSIAVNINLKLDWLGYFITGCAAVLFCMGLEWALNPCKFPSST